MYWYRAKIYMMLDEFDKAIDDYGAIYKMVAKEKDLDIIHQVLYTRAHVFYSMGDLESSDNDYKLMLKHDETDQVAMIGLTRNMIERRNYNDAVELCNKCEKYDNTYEEIYRFRMQAYDKLDKTDLAIDDAFLYVYHSEDADAMYIESIIKKHLSY